VSVTYQVNAFKVEMRHSCLLFMLHTCIMLYTDAIK
jgi:hypothetical protein